MSDPKVKIGCMYVPPQRYAEMDEDAERLQRALMRWDTFEDCVAWVMRYPLGLFFTCVGISCLALLMKGCAA